MPQVPAYVYASAAAVVFFLVGWWVTSRRYRRRDERSRRLGENILDEAEREAGNIVKSAELAAKEDSLSRHAAFDRETSEIRRENRRRQDSLEQREGNLDKKLDFIAQKEDRLDRLQHSLHRPPAKPVAADVEHPKRFLAEIERHFPFGAVSVE